MISERNKSKAQIFLLLIVFVLFIMLANNIFKGFRFDLTENKLYTLGDGTLNIINELQDEVTLNYYFSDSLTQDDTYLRAYAKRIKELLEEYELRSKGKIKLNIIDPVPFSDEEDDAMKYGLQGVPSKTKEENIFFGLVAANRYDSYKIIKFFDPGKEAIIEYEITKVLYSILELKKPKIGVMSSLPLFGGVSLSVERLNSIIKIDEKNLQAIVEPGVINQIFRDAVESEGLFYPPDPASKGSCFLGGNVAENAGGPKALKYGVTKNYVLNLEVVLPSGEIIWTGANVLKNAKVNPKQYQGYAFGVGIDRLAMLKYGINDLRAFFESDIRWLEFYGFDPLDVPTNYRGLSK